MNSKSGPNIKPQKCSKIKTKKPYQRLDLSDGIYLSGALELLRKRTLEIIVFNESDLIRKC